MTQTPLTIKPFSANDFNPDKFVKELSQRCVGGQELQRLRYKIQALSEETSSVLKKNVYHNYNQFIDTAKEISHLESEMYQLSHHLSEQSSLLSALANTSIVEEQLPVMTEFEGDNGTPTKKNEDQEEETRRHKLAEILEKVEGCIGILDVPGRHLLYEGDLLELDPTENSPLQRVHGYLLSDCLMLTSWITNRRGPIRYKFHSMYELGSLAVVNVRDMGTVKHAIKILAFPDTRIFQCSSNTTKKEWLEKLHQSKMSRLGQDQVKRESVTEKSTSATTSSESINVPEKTEEEIIQHPDWFLEVPEDLDVCVAQRHFEEAHSLIVKAKDYIKQHGTLASHDLVFDDIQRKVEARHKTLTEVLMKELEVTPDKSLQGGLRAARRAVRLLNQLGRSTQACELFLQLCSSILKAQCKRVKREGSTVIYVRHLASVVFTNMCHMTEEFLRAFPDSSNCTSAFIVWASTELSIFTSHLIKQAFMPLTSLSTLTECVVLVRTQCERLCEYGIDLCYQLDGALRTPLSRAIRDSRDKLIDAIKLRALDNKWTPLNLVSKQALSKCLQENAEYGIILDNYVTGDCWLQLTSNTLAFIKLYMALLDDCLKLQTPELLHTIDEILHEVFLAQLMYVESSFLNEPKNDIRQFIIKNGQFLLNVLLVAVEEKYEKCVGFPCKMLAGLHDKYGNLEKGPHSNKNVTKYSLTEYL